MGFTFAAGHQAAVFFALTKDPKDKQMQKWVPAMLILSALMIFAQW